jgi:drug/metabolite transporter (DMT)-like permease
VSQELAALAAAGAGACFGAASFVERLSAGGVPTEKTSVRHVLRLLLRPLLVLAVLCEVAGFGLQVTAIKYGPLVLVQPLLVLALPTAVAIEAMYHRRRPTTREFAGIGTVMAGIALFQIGASPATGTTSWSLARTGVVAAVLAIVIGALGYAAARARPGHRVVLMALVVGVMYGACAPLLKHLTATSSIGHLATEWETWALIVVGGIALGLNQVVFQDRRFGSALAVLTVADPLTAAVLGAYLLQESLPLSGFHLVAWATGAVVAVVGVFVLARAEDSLADSPGNGV